MALTLHTNYQFGSYLSDRERLLKSRENPNLLSASLSSKIRLSQLNPIFDGKDSLAIGYGFDLLVHSNAEILGLLHSANLTDVDFGWATASQKAHDLNLLDVYRQSRDGLSVQEWRNREGKLFMHFSSEPNATKLLTTLAAEAEDKLTQVFFSRGFQILDSNERLALVSMVYNGGLGMFGSLQTSKLLDALQAGNRARAWYEIRYSTNAEAKSLNPQKLRVAPGIANRRYEESNLLGLYEGNGQPLTDAEARNAVAVLNSHQRAIAAYEGRFPPLGVPIKQQILPAVQFLIASLGDPSNQDVLVASGPLGNGDAIQGTDVSELLLGDIGHDILIGGGGDDVLRGDQGKDVYVYNSDDGEDTILDTDRQGLVIFDHHLLQGGLKKQSEGVYTSLDGQVTYQRSGSDLVVNGTLTIKEWQEGQFGIRLKELPDDPEEPGLGGGGRDYKRIDHYIQVGVDAEGQPIMVPVFVESFYDGTNNTGDGQLVSPIGDEPNAINVLGGNDVVATGVGDDTELIVCGGR
ncbi:MAG: Lysozyme (modular protein) [Nitrospira sp.]|nr:MAG: Lysozyme (modular protein) [Nitrospira sp.]